MVPWTPVEFPVEPPVGREGARGSKMTPGGMRVWKLGMWRTGSFGSLGSFTLNRRKIGPRLGISMH